MLIESAFFKLPELLLSNSDHGSEVESTIVHLFASALQMEMNARNIPRPFASVLTEKPYDGVASDQKMVRADLHVNLKSAIDFDSRILAYGVRPLNWVEAKAPLSTHRHSAATLRLNSVAQDCLRLCLLPKEWQGPSTGTEHGRYLLWVVDSPPKVSICKELLAAVLPMGNHDLSVEAKGISLHATVRTLLFEPSTQNVARPLFWGFLLRIGHFTVKSGALSFTAEDEPGTGFTEESIHQLDTLRGKFVPGEEPISPPV